MGLDMNLMVLDYDILDVSCATCGNWVQLSGSDPRHCVEGYGFRFNGDTPTADFTCLECGCRADDSYHVIAKYVEGGKHDLRDVTGDIIAALRRHE